MHVRALLDDLGGASAGSRAAAIAEAGGERPLPRFVAWNLARRCRRAECEPCLVLAGAGAPPPGEFSTIESLHLAHQLIAAQPGLLLLSGGDPLAREDLETLVAHASRRGAHVAVATPAGRLTDQRLHALRVAGAVGVVVVLPGLTTADVQRRGHEGGDPDLVLSAVRRIAAAGMRAIAQALLETPSRESAAALVAHGLGEGAQALHVELAGAEREILAAERELAIWQRRLRGRLALRVTRRASAGEPDCPCEPWSCRITADGKLTACACAPAAAAVATSAPATKTAPATPTPTPAASTVLADLRRQAFAPAWTESPALRARRGLIPRDDDQGEPLGAPEPRLQLPLAFDGRAPDVRAP